MSASTLWNTKREPKPDAYTIPIGLNQQHGPFAHRVRTPTSDPSPNKVVSKIGNGWNIVACDINQPISLTYPTTLWLAIIIINITSMEVRCICCLTSHATIFQTYMWRHIYVQADWRRRTYGRAPNAIDISSKHWHGTIFFIVIPRNRTI